MAVGGVPDRPAQRLIQIWGDGFDAAVAPHRGEVATWYQAAEGYLRSDNLPVLVTKLLRATAEQVAPAHSDLEVPKPS